MIMQLNYNWKKGIFSESYQIFNNETQVGSLSNKCFSQTAHGELNEEKYTFKTTGFFKQHTQIIENNENKIIGEITYNNWMNKATININGQQFDLKYDNIWNTKWSISSLNETQISYNSTSCTGQIQSNTDNELLILSGLFVANYYIQMTLVVLLIVFIPILVRH